MADRTLLWAMFATLALAGCDNAPPGGTAVANIVAPAAAVPTAAPRPVPTATPTPGPDQIVRGITPPPTPSASDFTTEGVTRNFVDPPLPPELMDDGELKPLPRSRP